MEHNVLPRSANLEFGTAFVGRQRELSILGRHLDIVSSGQGRLALLSGEAGIGKTQIALAFAAQARQRGVAVLSGCAFEGDWHPPYGPWVEALGGYARATEPARLRQQLGAGAAPVAHLVPRVRAVLSDVPAPPPLTPEED